MKSKIMVVLAPYQQERLRNLLAGQGMEIILVPNFHEARKELSGTGSYDLVFADAELPDGSWRDLLQLLIDSSRHCELIVCSRVGDERLWARSAPMWGIRSNCGAIRGAGSSSDCSERAGFQIHADIFPFDSFVGLTIRLLHEMEVSGAAAGTGHQYRQCDAVTGGRRR